LVRRLGGHQSRSGYRKLLCKSRKRRTLVRNKRKWEDNIKKGLSEMDVRAWVPFMCFRIMFSGELL
jgi:hypothetical protein